MKKILILFALIGTLQAQESNYMLENTIDTIIENNGRAGSCASPDGSMNSTPIPPPSYAWLQSNGYCNPGAYGNFVTVCWTFVPTSSSVSINSGYSQTGCVNVGFGGFNLYDNTCTLIGTGLNFSGLTPGNTYTWCMSAAAWGGGPGCIGFTDFCPYYTNNAVLPIDLIYFKGKNSYGINFLNWSTASEIDNNYFKINRLGKDSIWNTLAVINGAGNSSHEIEYSWQDTNPHWGINYYQLEQTDYDGSNSYSDIIVVDNTSDFEIVVYPNPNKGYDVKVMGIEEETHLKITGIGGDIIHEFILEEYTFKIPYQLEPGMYFFKFTSNTQNSVKKIIVE